MIGQMGSAQTPDAPTIALPGGVASEELSPGHTLGRYAILDTLGSGGMGRVYRAYDPKLRREVAIKQLKVTAEPSAQVRIVREAQAMAQLSHPNVLPVFDVDADGGQVFVAMEYVDGVTLGEWVRAREGRWREIVQAFVDAGQGLAAAHHEGLIHRDFKPANVLVGADGRVRVLDFGLVQLSDVPEPTPATDPGIGSLGSQPNLTGFGTVMGTPRYMSPEQHGGVDLDARSDQYSFCVALFEALHGRPPFPQRDYVELAAAKGERRIDGAPAPRGLPRRVRAAVRRGLSPDRDDRFPHMDALLAQLRQALASRRRRFVGVAGIGLVAVGGFVAASRDDPTASCEAAAGVIDELWSEDARESLRRAFVDSGSAAAPDVWARAEAAIDDWAERWTKQHVDACLATHERAVQSQQTLDLRMQCLRRRRLAVAAVFDGWRDGLSPATLGAAASAAAGLPGPERCGDLEALRAAIPPPEDPELAEEVGALRDRLATAEGLSLAARYQRALDEAVVVRDRALALGYRPLLAASRLLLGKVRSSMGAHTEAAEATRAAYYDAVAVGDDGAATEASILLVAYVGRALHEPDEAARWQRSAQAWVDRSADDGPRARLHEAIGGNHLAQSEFAEALDRYTEAYELRARNDDPLAVSLSLNAMGVASMRLGRYAEAVDMYARAEAATIEVLGPEHPDVAVSATNMGNALERQGKLDEAEAELRRALRGFERTLGEDHPNIAVVLTNLGNVLTSRGEHEAARPVFERALAVAEASFGGEHPMVAAAHNNLGENLHARGRIDEALAAHQRGLALRIEIFGEDHPEVAVSRENLGEIFVGRGDFAQARGELEAALEIRLEAELDPRLVANNELLLARVLWRGELDRVRARELAASALGRFETMESPGDGLAGARRLLAEIDGGTPASPP